MFFFLGQNTLSFICMTQIECKSFTDDKNFKYVGVYTTSILVQISKCICSHQTCEVLLKAGWGNLSICVLGIFSAGGAHSCRHDIMQFHIFKTFFGGIKCANFWSHCSMNPFVHLNVLVVQVHMPSYARGWSTLLLIIPNQCHMVNGVP